MTTARNIAKALGGKYSNSGWIATCPAHDDRTPSLSIRDASNGKTLLKCHAGCKQLDIISALRFQGLWDIEPRRGLSTFAITEISVIAPPNDRSASAMALWAEARSLDGSVGLTYLANRGVDLGALPPELHRALRWHPSCPWEGVRHACMIALFTDAITGQPKAIHRTAINQAGEKIGRKVLGPMAGCVIRLWPDETVTDGLVLGEGIETTLVAATQIEHRGTYLRPAWAAGSAGSLAKFPVLAGVKSLTLLVDNDESGAGQRAAEECSAKWTAAGREVFRLVPKAVGVDFNDLVVERAHA